MLLSRSGRKNERELYKVSVIKYGWMYSNFGFYILFIQSTFSNYPSSMVFYQLVRFNEKLV